MDSQVLIILWIITCCYHRWSPRHNWIHIYVMRASSNWYLYPLDMFPPTEQFLTF